MSDSRSEALNELRGILEEYNKIPGFNEYVIRAEKAEKFLYDVYNIETCEDCRYYKPSHPSGYWCDLTRGEDECLSKLDSSLNEVNEYIAGKKISKRYGYYIEEKDRPDH